MMGRHQQQQRPWLCTLVTQIFLCSVLYLFINLGKPQKPINYTRNGGRPSDVYFISVSGGFRPLQEQIHLLNLIKKVVGDYDASFVINVSEFGEEDPLTQNATLYSHLSKVPWFTTTVLKGHRPDYFIKQIKIPSGDTFDIIAMNTALDPSSDTANEQKEWLTKTLEASNSNWRIVVGFHPLVSCDGNIDEIETKEIIDSPHDLFRKYGVDVYLSGLACSHFANTGVIENMSYAGPRNKGPYLTAINQRIMCNQETPYWFLLHRMSSLELATYLITFTGEVVHKVTQQQRGKDDM